VRTDSDVVVFITRTGSPIAVKIACSEAGASALAAQRGALQALRATPGLNGFGALVPEVLDHGTIDGRRYLVEEALPGTDARACAAGPAASDAMAATARRMAGLYAATGHAATIEPARLALLLDDHIDRIASAHGPGAAARLGALRSELAEGLLGRRAVIARTHGDLWLGNVLLDEELATVTGLVDWEASRPEDLPAVDLAHLVLATRCAVEGRDIADVAGRLIDGEDELTPRERALLEPWVHDAIDLRYVVLAAWLQHVSQRVAQSTLHDRGRWMRRNVDPVLARFAP
jgi:aminoglycoside phosphotransferase